MPIITPAYPEMNSAYNVGEPQLRRMKQEIERGFVISQQVLQGKAKWEDLVCPSDFFQKYEQRRERLNSHILCPPFYLSLSILVYLSLSL